MWIEAIICSFGFDNIGFEIPWMRTFTNDCTNLEPFLWNIACNPDRFLKETLRNSWFVLPWVFILAASTLFEIPRIPFDHKVIQMHYAAVN